MSVPVLPDLIGPNLLPQNNTMAANDNTISLNDQPLFQQKRTDDEAFLKVLTEFENNLKKLSPMIEQNPIYHDAFYNLLKKYCGLKQDHFNKMKNKCIICCYYANRCNIDCSHMKYTID